MSVTSSNAIDIGKRRRFGEAPPLKSATAVCDALAPKPAAAAEA